MRLLFIITDFNKINRLQSELVNALLRFDHEKIYATVGYHGGSHQDEVYWFEDLGFWFLPVELDNRYWNAFGTEKPIVGANLAITCEINFPFAGINRQIAGAFVQDEASVFIVHRGKIGGSQKGGGKKLFLNHFRGEWIEVYDDGLATNVALVGSLTSAMFGYQLREFVTEVKRIKNTLQEPAPTAIEAATIKDDFKEEFFGAKSYEMRNIIEAKCNHGLVVSHLAKYLTDRGFCVSNDMHRDLFILNEQSQVKAVFEVKTDSGRDSLYAGVGQLLLNSNQLRNVPSFVLVLPQQPALHFGGRINQLGLQIVTYKWIKEKYQFDFNKCSI